MEEGGGDEGREVEGSSGRGVGKMVALALLRGGSLGAGGAGEERWEAFKVGNGGHQEEEETLVGGQSFLLAGEEKDRKAAGNSFALHPSFPLSNPRQRGGCLAFCRVTIVYII